MSNTATAPQINQESAEQYSPAELFYFEHFSRHLGATSPATAKPTIPIRVKAGIKRMALGTLDTYYLVRKGQAITVGVTNMQDTEQVKFVPAEKEAGARYVMLALIEHRMEITPDNPVLVGMVSLATPNSSFRLSYSPEIVHFCKKGGGFSFNLINVKEAYQHIQASKLDYEKVILKAYRAHWDMTESTEQAKRDKQKEVRDKLIAEHPNVIDLLKCLKKIRPDSGEHQALSWAMRLPKMGAEQSV